MDDPLPASLAAGPVGLLAYRVEILNPSGRSAGRSNEAYTAGGAAPPMVEGLVATAIRRGVRLGWTPEALPTAIELDRVEVGAPAGPTGGRSRGPVLAAKARPAAEVHLRAKAADDPDAGGTVDASAQKGTTYRYTAQRVRAITLEGHPVEIRSVISGAVSVKVLDTFAPQAPAGLEAAAGAGEVPSIDLSWQPGAEADLGGYNVYRREASTEDVGPSGWARLNDAVVAIPAFSDRTARAERRYVYRVTAVDVRGNESAPSNEVQETPGTR